MILSIIFFLTSCVISVSGHGYLLEPVARSTAWLVDQSFRPCCTYSNHMEMFCGGITHQWSTHGGKCGICGEPYDKANKLFEKGGAMYTGKIVKTYTQGQQIDVTVVLTANHKGYFEFRLCNLDSNPNSEATQDCLDRGLLKMAGTDSTKWRDVDKYGSETIKIRVQLPSNVACRHCVFQWKYTTGNNWGTDPATGQSGSGMGIENETFMGCSDISIVANGSPVETLPPVIVTTNSPVNPGNPQTTTTTTTTTTPRPSGGLTTWSSSNVLYKVGHTVSYDGVKYLCVHDHTSFVGAEPGPLTWAWWKRID
ncbi:unnamed protein product [Adineta steineri]|uniref:Chitin-binding type-4 domain-containing protein n=1 Tax=Adineta steineri TaxID=433720 RepID=A0A816G4U1_9BILA|nr:unnamed protein product [Adineta steineri]CAF1670333.1 unnamed protein product [Adineta steineri]